MSEKVKALKSINPIGQIVNRFLFWTFYVPIIFMVVNTLVGWLIGEPLVDALTVQDTVFIIGGMFLSILQFLWSVISLDNPIRILGHMGDFFVGFLLLGSEYAGLIVKAWLWIFLFPFELVKLLFGFDLLFLTLDFPIKAFGIGFDVTVTLDIRGLIEEIISAIVETFRPDISPYNYMLAKFDGDVVGFDFDTNPIASLFGSGALLRALKVKFVAENKSSEWWEEKKKGLSDWLDNN